MAVLENIETILRGIKKNSVDWQIDLSVNFKAEILKGFLRI